MKNIYVKMKPFSLSFIALFVLLSILAEPADSVVYYVLPTQPLSSCPGNSSCPPGQLSGCHTMDNLTMNSSDFFSSDKANITLIFMCGIHNCTKNLTLQNLHSFIMEGAAESRENVIISMVRQVAHPVTLGTDMNEPICTSIEFFNVSSVNLTTMTMICPSINLKGGLITVKNSNLYGHTDLNKVLSFLSITGQDSQAIINDCVLKHNCFFCNKQYACRG